MKAYLASCMVQMYCLGTVELSAASTNRWDKGRGHYYANDFNVELEYGVTDKLEIAGYL